LLIPAAAGVAVTAWLLLARQPASYDPSLAPLVEGRIDSVTIRFFPDIFGKDVQPIVITDANQIRRTIRERLARAEPLPTGMHQVAMGEMTVTKGKDTYSVTLFHPLSEIYFGGRQHQVDFRVLREHLHQALGYSQKAKDWI